MVAPDDKTLNYLRGKAFAPRGDDFIQAEQQWLGLVTDAQASFDREVHINAADISPTVPWGVSPEEAISVHSPIPDPSHAAHSAKAQQWTNSLDYMGLTAGQSLQDVLIDRVFIGSCTNARLEDLRSAAQVLQGRQCVIPGIVSPGSSSVKALAEAEGLDTIFINAGLEWHNAGCSMCVGMNGDLIAPGERCASSTNRNFKGRQGPGARTHLMSPAMVAAAAVTGRIMDFRQLPQADVIQESTL
jgi:3-isopropylmalate/(R)-2-methylmalate dehydratase large subunit